MRAKLTDQLCSQKAPPKGQVIEIWDIVLPGLCLRIYSSGARTFSLMPRERVTGKQRRVSLWPRYPLLSLAEARRQGRDMMMAWMNGAALPDPPKPSESTEAIITRWLKSDRVAKARTHADIAWVVRRALKPWSDQPINFIKRGDLQRRIDEIRAHHGSESARMAYTYLGGLFKWAAGREYVPTNPTVGLDVPQKAAPRERVLDDAELRAVWLAVEAMGWPYEPIVKLLILTAARLNEVGKLSWTELDLDKKEWLLPAERAKNGHEHLIPLSPQAMAVIEPLPTVVTQTMLPRAREAKANWERVHRARADHPDWLQAQIAAHVGLGESAVSVILRTRIDDTAIDANGLVFPNSRGTTTHDWDRRKKEIDRLSGVSGWTLHDLRRTAATGMQRLGVKLEVTEKVLNHVSGKIKGVAAIYHRYDYRDEKQAALEAWGRHVDLILTGEEAKVISLSIRRADTHAST
jgi:integrase